MFHKLQKFVKPDDNVFLRMIWNDPKCILSFNRSKNIWQNHINDTKLFD